MAARTVEVPEMKPVYEQDETSNFFAGKGMKSASKRLKTEGLLRRFGLA
jgi:hypothetical protein